MQAHVIVTLKNGVLDPQGEAIARALKTLGFDGVNNVRVGKWIAMDVEGEDAEATQAQVQKMADELLANPVIEDFKVEVEKTATTDDGAES